MFDSDAWYLVTFTDKNNSYGGAVSVNATSKDNAKAVAVSTALFKSFDLYIADVFYCGQVKPELCE